VQERQKTQKTRVQVVGCLTLNIRKRNIYFQESCNKSIYSPKPTEIELIPTRAFVGQQIVDILFILKAKIILNNRLIFNAKLLISFVDVCNNYFDKQG
jgi:hypothetical protein